MDNITDPALRAEIEDLRDEIALKETILESLDENAWDNSEDEELRHTTQKELRRLQKHLRALLPPPKREHHDGLPLRNSDQTSEAMTNERPASRHSDNAQQHDSNLSSHLMPPPNHELPNRKRLRQDSLDDGRPESSKSRRTSPSPGSANTAAPSPAASSASLSSLDDPFADPLFGGFSREEIELNQDFWKRREHQVEQEESDARLAERLSQEWAQDAGSDTTQAIGPRPSEYTQSFFKTDGSINRFPASQHSYIGDSTRQLQPIKIDGTINRSPAYQPSYSGSSTRQFQPVKTDGSINLSPAYLPSYAAPAYQPSYSSDSTRHLQLATTELSTNNTQPLPSVKSEASDPRAITADPGFTFPPAMPGAFPAGPSYSSVGGRQVYNSMPFTPHNYLTISDSSDDDSPPSSFPGRPAMPLPSSSFPTPSAYSSYGYQDEAQTQEQLMELLRQIRPDEELTADQIPQQPPGLKATLMPHQLSGVAWMKRMEEGTNKGGILADDMGLGKTLQSIALMLERPPAADKHCPTLIVAPVALMHQWKREIEKMVRPRFRMNVFILHGDSRKATWTALKAYDVVLTTYGLLTSELKRKKTLDEKVKNLKDWHPSVTEDCPILGDRSRFHRVILDEAQNIKNRDAKASLAACRIQAEYRWALTGTPMQNSTEEIFSLIRFTRIAPYNNWENFRRAIGGPLHKKNRNASAREAAMKTLQALLRAILLRRTKQSKILGQPILQLPPKETREDRVPFDQDQLDFYTALETSAQIQVNKYLQKGTLGRNYSEALVLLLRLRQACCHPALVVASRDFIQLPGGELDTDALLRNAEQLDAKVVERLKQLGAYECPICFDVAENPAVFFCGHAICGDCLNQLVEQATNDNNGAPPVCPHCRARIDVNNVTDYTSFLRVHCPDRVEAQEQKDDGPDTDSDSDDYSSGSSDEGDDLGGFIVYDDVEEKSEDEPKQQWDRQSSKSKSKKGKERSRSKSRPRVKEPLKSLAQLRKEGLRNKAAKRKYLKRLQKNFHPSVKITRTIELLEEIKNKGENDKTIIFSNFTSFLDLVELPLWKHKDFSKYVRYDGSMSAKDRNDAVLEFTDNPNCKVILVSLRAGNAGLNLTAANHVIMLDPFWNPFVEYQAADRCYRIGQTKDVTIHRVLIGERDSDKPSDSAGSTVEDRILQLQERKRELVETALDESAGRAVSRLGVRELGYLFGLNAL